MLDDLVSIRTALALHKPLALPTFGRKASAVLIPLMEHEGEVCVILTRRSANLPMHAGEISFPGGHVEPQDTSTLDAALREAWEEVGIPPEACEHLGAMDDFSTVTGYRISPHVVALNRSVKFTPVKEEVAEILMVPWSLFSRQPTDMRLEVFRKGRREHFPLYRHQGNLIWGATARMMADLVDVVQPGGLAHKDKAATAVLQRILDSRRVVVTTHLNPDPDGLCAEMAMEELLLALGKEVRIANCHPTPPIWPSISFRSPLIAPYAAGAIEPHSFDLLLVLDTSEHKRLGTVASLAHASAGKIAAVDHHLDGSMGNETLLLDSEASSTCETVYTLLLRMGFPMTPRAANALYMGILYDTNGFRYINNRSLPLKAAAHLVEMGADASSIQEELFSNVTPGRLRAQSIAVERLTLEYGGQLAWTWLNRSDCSSHEIDDEDTSEISSMLLSMRGVRVSAFFRELADSTPGNPRFKLSMRSLRHVPIGPVCMKFGGGGHANAAGATFHVAPEVAMDSLRPYLEAVLAGLTA